MLQPDRNITVRAGDSLERIAAEHLGSSSYFRDIADFNELDIFEELPVASIIVLPTISSIKETIETGLVSLDNKDMFDLSSVKMSNTGDSNLLSWIL